MVLHEYSLPLFCILGGAHVNQRDAMDILGIEPFKNPAEYTEAQRLLNVSVQNVERATDRLLGRRKRGKNIRTNKTRAKSRAPIDSGGPIEPGQ